jgi:hypothetical protein
MANLGLDGQGQYPPGFAAFDQPPPPPPKLNSRGVVATDITNEFTTAAKSMSFPEGLISRADTGSTRHGTAD